MTEAYSEAQTRQQVIDRRLALAGWNVKDPSQVTEELDIDLTKDNPPSPRFIPGRPGRFQRHRDRRDPGVQQPFGRLK